MRTLHPWIPHHHQLDHHHQLNREVAPEEKKDLDRVSEYLHFHLRMPASSRNLLYILLELSRFRLWQLRAQMKIQQLWINNIAWATVQGHHKNKKAHGERVHKDRRERKLLQNSSRVDYRRPRKFSPWIEMKTMKNLKTSLEPLQTLNLL